MKHIWFIHTPRTGGMSIAKFLGKLHRESKLYVIHQGHTKHCVTQKEKYAKELGDKVITFTILRDPVEHSRSLYSYMKASKGHNKHPLANNNNFSTWLTKFDEFPYYRIFFGGQTIESAVNNLLSIDYILYTDKLAVGLNKLLQILNVADRFDNSKINGYPKPDVSDKDINLIKKIRADDYEILKQISEKHNNRLV